MYCSGIEFDVCLTIRGSVWDIFCSVEVVRSTTQDFLVVLVVYFEFLWI